MKIKRNTKIRILNIISVILIIVGSIGTVLSFENIGSNPFYVGIICICTWFVGAVMLINSDKLIK